jgi:CubicO group peptidase (beta-lactamase class C family)
MLVQCLGCKPSLARRAYGPMMAAAIAMTVALVATAQNEEPAPLTSGVWQGAMGPWTIVLEFSGSGGERIEGVAHILEGSHKWTEATVTQVVVEPSLLAWHLGWGSSWKMDFRGRIDLAAGSMEGDLSGLAASAVPMRFERADPDAIAGLRARPGSAEYGWSRPPETGDGWPTAAPGENSLQQSQIEDLVRAILRGEAGDIHSVLIAEGNALVAEEYFHGWAREELHGVASCTKSVTSLLVGRALDDGLLPALTTPVLELVSGLADESGAGWESVRLEHLLTMTAGLDRAESAEVEAPRRSLFLSLLDLPVRHPPGSHWQYANADVDLFGAILRNATGVDADDYAASVLFGPLGIERWEWPKGDGPFPSMSAGLKLRPRDLAKIGMLVSGRGQWQGQRVVSESWIERSTQGRVAIPERMERYGYLWWSVVPPEAPERFRVVYAIGVGSQFVFVVPALDWVVTITGGNQANGQLMAIRDLVFRYLLSPRALPR